MLGKLPDSPAPGNFRLCSGAVCRLLAAGNGFLRARIRGALKPRFDWKKMPSSSANGSERPNGHGIRLSFGRPTPLGRPTPAHGVLALRPR